MLEAALTQIQHPKKPLKKKSEATANIQERNPSELYTLSGLIDADGLGNKKFLCQAIEDGQKAALIFIEPKN